MSACRNEIRELLLEYVHGLLDPEEAGRVSDHLEVCLECASDVKVLRQLEDEVLPDPEPWFFVSLPSKVTAEIETRRKKKARVLIPVWAGGFAVAALAVVMFLLSPIAPAIETDVPFSTVLETGGSFSLGFEEEILSVSGMFVDDLDQAIGEDLDTVSDYVFITTHTILEGDVYDTMDEETIRVFETLVEEMTPENIRKKVMS